MSRMADGALRVNVFKGVQNLPLFVAMREGYFAARGLAIDLSYTTGSAVQLAGLVRGDFDLVQTAPDNVINVDTQPGAFGLEAGIDPQVMMFLGGTIGPLGVYARPGISDVASLREATLGVDNPTSGFAIVLRDLLWRHGLALERDYRFVVAGGTHARCDAVSTGTIDATILYLPFDLRAAARGCTLLASSEDVYPAYASSSTAGVRSWIEAHEVLVTAYIEAILLALRWIRDPGHAGEVQNLLRTESELGVPPELVAQTYALLISQKMSAGGETPLDARGLRQVIALRATYGAPGVSLGQLGDYSDPRWYDAALARLGAGG